MGDNTLILAGAAVTVVADTAATVSVPIMSTDGVIEVAGDEELETVTRLQSLGFLVPMTDEEVRRNRDEFNARFGATPEDASIGGDLSLEEILASWARPSDIPREQQIAAQRVPAPQWYCDPLPDIGQHPQTL